MTDCWTLKSLKEYFERRLTDMEKAVTKAEIAHEKRLEGMNEFRSQLKDQQQTFVDRNYHIAQYTALEERMREMKRDMDKAGGHKEGVDAVWAYLIAGVSLLTAVVSMVISLIR